MKRSLVMTVLILISMQLALFAQNETLDFYNTVYGWSKTKKTFNVTPLPNVEDFVYLKNGKMIVEMQQIGDYKYLAKLDSILTQFTTDIAFYKDSLENGTGNVRIDYSLEHGKDYRQIRFLKHNPEGDIYVNRHGETERLKLEQDTVRIILQLIPGTTISTSRWLRSMQVTFVLNNYRDIEKIVSEKTVMLHAIDTLASVRGPAELDRAFTHPSSCIYRPYFARLTNDSTPKFFLKNHIIDKMYFVKFDHILKKEYGQYADVAGTPTHRFAAYGNIGVGIVRNTISPNAELGISYFNYGSYRNGKDYDYYTLFASPYFFFDRKPDGEYLVSDNWFINLQAGSSYDEEMLGVKIRGFSVGIGYLAVEKGNYFKANTFKAFCTVRLMSGVSICPELIATNNFKQVFPGITFKIFGVKREKY